MKKKVSLIIIVILIMQVVLPLLTVLLKSDFTLVSKAAQMQEATIDGITWTYELGGNKVYNLKPKDKNDIYKEIKIPDSINGSTVVEIGYDAFWGWKNLEKVTIPESVTTLSSSVFRDCSNLTSVNIPKGVTMIGAWAFCGCSKIDNIEIPDGITVISRNAFTNCTNLKNLKISDNIEKIMFMAFYECSNLSNIELPNKLKTIEADVFSGCESLTSVTIPASVTSIGSGAFARCSSLTKIEVSNDNTKYKSEDGVLFNKESTELMCYPGGKKDTSYIVPSSTTKIWGLAFSGCTNLTSLEIPNGVTTIGNLAFYYSSITNIKIPNSITSIGQEAFSGCTGLTKIEIPSSVTKIENYAFNKCENLTKIAVPSTVTDIGNYAFKACPNITIYCKSNSYAKQYAEENNIEYCIDETGPKINNVIRNTIDLTRNHVTLTVNAEDNLSGLANEAYSFDGGETWQKDNYMTYLENKNNITIEVKDSLGNISTYSEVINITNIIKLEKGDVNGDGVVDFTDMLEINKHRLGKERLTGKYLEAADVNGDEEVDFKDMLRINKYRLGKTSTL